MKILIVINDYYNKTNGMCISTQRFVSKFIQSGHEVRVVANNTNGEPYYALKDFKLPLFSGVIKKQGYTFAKVNRHILREAIAWADIVHIEDPFYLCYVASKIARKLKKPVTGTFHLYPENLTYSVKMGHFWPINALFLKTFKTFVYDNCILLHCPTEDVKKRLNKYGFKSALRVISNGVDENKIAKRTEKPDELKDKILLLCIGRYSKEKDQKTLLKALAKCKHKNEIQVVLAGKGPMEDSLKKLGDKLPIKPIMKFFSQDKLKTLMGCADLCVHCAQIEVEGMACMEAFASGVVPIIANAPLSSTKAYALSANNLFKAKDINDLAKKIDYWVDNKEERELYSRKYIEFAKDLTLSNSANDLMHMLEEAVENHKQYEIKKAE